MSPESTNIILNSLSDIRNYHRELLSNINETNLTAGDADKIRLFVNKVREAGRYIGDEDERWTSQGFLDYWATTLFSHSDNVPDAELIPFDEDAAPKLPDTDCPYVGLRSFLPDDSDIYFGRENEIAQVLELLNNFGFVVVTGPSGAGKSSLVGAGLIPSLIENKYILSNNDVIWFSPGEKLEESLNNAENILDKKNNLPTLVVIDQLEEIFTLCSDSKLADEFVSWMIMHAMSNNSKLYIVAILSETFLQQFFVCAEDKHRCKVENYSSEDQPKGNVLSRFSECEKRVYRLLPLDIARLRDVIIKPSRMRNLYFEPSVVDSIIDDLSAEPNPLPLLQFTLTQLWKLRKGNRIKFEHYKQIGGESILYGKGGAKDSLAVCAEKLYWSLSNTADKVASVAKQYTFKNLLLRLIQLQEDGDIALKRVREERLLEWTEPDVIAESMRKLRDINNNHGIAILHSNHQVSRMKLTNEELDSVKQNLSDTNIVKYVLNILHKAGLVRRFSGGDEKVVQIEIAHEVLVRNWPTLRRWTQEKAIRDELEFIREIKRATLT